MGVNSKFHKIIGAAEIVVGAVLDLYGQTYIGNSLILAGLATFQGVPGAPAPVSAAINATLSSPIAPMQILYGTTKVGGLLVAGDSDNVSDANYKYLAVAHSLTLKNGTSAIPLAGPLTTGNYYIDNNPVLVACVDSNGAPSGTGAVSGSGSVGNLINYDGILWLKTYKGDQTTADGWLTGGLSYWLSTAVGKGIAYTVAKIHADPTSDQVNAAFANGLPRSIAVELQGQKVYDPRLDSTAGGSGSQRKTDPTTWTYSANPALCLRDYLVRPVTEGGAGQAYTVIPDDFLAAAATVCDTALTIPNGLGGTTTEPKYQCGVGLLTSDSIPTNVQKLLDSMAGWIVESGGQLRIFAGAYTAPVTTLDEDWLCGSPTFQTTAEQDQRFNTVNATFTDPASAYATVQTPSFAEAGAVTADGGIPLVKNLNLPAVPNQYNCQLITQISAKQSREQAQMQFPANLMAMDVDCGETVEVSIGEYGLSSAVYRVLNWQRKGDSSILLTLQAANSNTFTPETFTTVTALGQPPLTPQPPPTPTNLVVTGGVGLISLSWDDLKPWAVSSYEVWRSTSSGGTYTQLKPAPTTASFTDPLTVTATYWYKVRAKNYLGKYSSFTSPASGTSTNVTDMVGGIGANLMDPRYSIYTTTLPTFATHTDLTMGRAASTKVYNYLTLQAVSSSAGSSPVLALAKSTSDNTKPGWVQLNKKKYSIQVWGWDVDADGHGMDFAFRFYNVSGAACAGVTVTAVTGVGGGAQGIYAAQLDLTGATDTLVYVQLEWNHSVGVGHRVDLQGFAIFEMAGTSSVTPDFVPAPAASQDQLADGDTAGSVLVVAKNSNGAIDLSQADTGSGNGLGIENAKTSVLLDDAALGQTADATQTTNLPTTVGAAIALGMLTDAQTALPATSGQRWSFFSDSGGAIYAAPQYDTNVNFGGDSTAVATTSSVTSTVTVSNTVGVINPGQSVNIIAEADCMVSDNTATVTTPRIWIEYSLDGGTTWTAGPTANSTFTALNGSQCSLHAGLIAFGVTPTADLLFRVRGAQTVATSITFNMRNLSARLEPVANYYIIGSGNLTASLPATAAMGCSTTYPTTSCTASKNLTVTTSGGNPPYTFSNVKTAGTGTITSGASAQTFTVADTETTTTGGATFTTTVQSTVTDTQTYTMSTGATESGTTVTGTLTASALMAVGTLFDMASVVPAGYNGTGLAALSGTTGTTLKYTAGTSGLGATTHTGTVSNVRVVTSTCVVTGTFTLSYPAVSVSITSSGGMCRSVSGTCSAIVNLTTNASGGDGSYSYSNVKLSGGGTVTSGASSKNWTAAESGTVPWSDTGSYKSTVTDGHSNSGNKSKTLSFSGTVIS